MIKVVRNVSALLLAAVTVLAVASCGGANESSGTSPSADQPKPSGTITVWDTEYETIPTWTKAMDKIDRQFEEKNPGVTVHRVAEPYEGWEAIYRAAFTAHEGPDAMLMQPGLSGVLNFQEGLEPLNDRISPDLKKHLTQWESVTPGLATKGEAFGIPLTTQGWLFYYNKKLFAKAGLPTSFAPKTWAEVREAGEKLEAAGIQPFTGGNKEGLENSWWFSVGYQSENTPKQTQELAEGKIDWTDHPVTKAFRPLIEMQEAGLYPSDRFSTPLFTRGYPRFAEGEGAMILGFMETIGYWAEFVPALGEGNVGMFFPPGRQPVATLGNVAFSIPRFAKNKDGAYALLEYMASKEGEETLADFGYLPNRDDVHMPTKYPVQAQELEEAADGPDRTVAPFISSSTPVIWSALPRELNSVLQGRVSLEDAQDALEEIAERSGS